MIKLILEFTYYILDLFNIWWSSSFIYYREKSEQLSIYFNCRQNKYTKRKYLRTMRPLVGTSRGIWNSNEWIEYEGKIDDNINYKA